MQQRTNFHHLPEDHRKIILLVHRSKIPFNRLELARRFTGAAIDHLLEQGHLSDEVSKAGQGIVGVTALTKQEMERLAPWRSTEDRYLMEAWPNGVPASDIAVRLSRSGGEVLMRARELELVRTPDFRGHIPAWRFRRLRYLLADAERRGIDLDDDGTRINHRAFWRRFFMARQMLLAPIPPGDNRWNGEDLTTLRALRSEGRSIGYIAQALKRPATVVARRLLLEGRAVAGPWRLDEDREVIDGLENSLSYTRIAKRLPGRSLKDVKQRARALSGKRAQRTWTHIENQSLIDGVVKEGLIGKKLAARVLSRGEHSVRRYFYKMVYQQRDNLSWSEADLNILHRAVKRGENCETIAHWLGRDPAAVEPVYQYFAVSRHGAPRKITPDMVRKAQEMKTSGDYEGKDKEIAEKLGFSTASLYRVLKDARGVEA